MTTRRSLIGTVAVHALTAMRAFAATSGVDVSIFAGETLAKADGPARL
ncbi:hypothetical protein [Tropicibacter naphthalenivorans]|uniref:Uncharacterized protein n=1 Tax=Tropicibacter naphthalenivorans TaxID=441103 RepID=A0A0N7M122_9RHOB|nr:hypothetical protein [Tropicibacter naphthalenivorans]CUH82057.1 hypothetical protein TRN7648_03792 [Tropicibacter naphthalenivorans]SMD08351.1 hypothetical protein SAMN04488093_11717 [Tropicibacter naphthalenivorans]